MQVQQQPHIDFKTAAVRMIAGGVVGGAIFGLGGKLPATLVGVGIGLSTGIASTMVGNATLPEYGLAAGAVAGAVGGVALSRFLMEIPSLTSRTKAISAATVVGLGAGVIGALAGNLIFPADASEGARTLAPAG